MKHFFLKAEDVQGRFIVGPHSRDVYDHKDSTGKYYGYQSAEKGLFIMQPESKADSRALAAPFFLRVELDRPHKLSDVYDDQKNIGTLLVETRQRHTPILIIGDENPSSNEHSSPVITFDPSQARVLEEPEEGIVTFRGCGHIKTLAIYSAGFRSRMVSLHAGKVYVGAILLMADHTYEVKLLETKDYVEKLKNLVADESVHRVLLVGAFVFARSQDDTTNGIEFLTWHALFVNLAINGGKTPEQGEELWQIGDMLNAAAQHRNNVKRGMPDALNTITGGLDVALLDMLGMRDGHDFMDEIDALERKLGLRNNDAGDMFDKALRDALTKLHNGGAIH